MIKTVIYTTKANQMFSILPDNKGIVLNISDNNYLTFSNKEEVDEFCKILQTMKEDFWSE